MIEGIIYHDREDDRWPATRGNHTDEAAIERVNGLPECVRDHVWTNDPCWSYVPSGWRDLLVELHNTLVLVAPDYRVSQIKEKFGSLRFYDNVGYEGPGENLATIIVSHFESRSAVTCDVCGEHGKIVEIEKGMPFVASRCGEHYVENKARGRTYEETTNAGPNCT